MKFVHSFLGIACYGHGIGLSILLTMECVMNIEWDYNYYQPWSDNEWLVDEMLAMLDEDVMMQ